MSAEILILSIGKATKEYRPLMDHWLKMIKYPITQKELSSRKSNLSHEAQKIEEANIIKQSILKNSFVIALDPLGATMNSEKFSTCIERNFEAARNITFIIGGAYGLAKDLVSSADMTLSLSAMTMPHLLAKLMLIEQIYRAQTIIENHPYHK